ncbi:MAG TPA: flavodoxin domain-containing protein [Actinophytocola sp.]|uniref:flavodoxin domain-containing protein n=1 Tax=Actinophytocola sp. TaxID=1872138 RepID=UPI002DBE2A69|nr:flavodoxin domain-containing protein [Actinophytocola sp.]HEU5474943.1 flavodoxin domain-containing protein [Actinophytocola sp.]
MTRVLVAFASKMGSTKDIAEAIGAELQKHGLRAEVRNVREADSPDYYDAVVLGSAVYAGRWRSEATHWVNRHSAELARHPVWLFESGWIDNRPEKLTASPGGRKRAARIGAEAPTVFGGRLDPGLATGFFDRQLAKRMPGDSRDFTEIRTWAGQIADTLATAAKG